MFRYMARDIILYFNYFAIFYHLVANGFYAVFVISAGYYTFRHLLRLRYGDFRGIAVSPTTPPISIFVAAHNEESNIAQSVRALLLLEYPSHEVIVINDGSTDQTLQRLISEFHLRPIDLVYRPLIPTQAVLGFYTSPALPNLLVVNKSHGGKADALNAGINVSRCPYFCSVDADSILEKDALLRLIRPVIESPDPKKIVAIGGIVRIVNGCRVKEGRIASVGLPHDSLSLLQIVEYLRSFLFGRTGWSVFNSLLIISGTFSMFHKKTVQEVGGYNTKSLTEDMEIVVRLHRFLRANRRPYRICFVHDPICWTEAPTTMKMLARQRRRWHRGLAESLIAHRGMLFNPRYRQVGLISIPYHLFIETFGPATELSGYVVVTLSFLWGIIDVSFFMLFIILAFLFGVLLSTGAILLEEFTSRRYPRRRDILILLGYGILENFGYRQLIAWWRVQALFQLLRKRRWEHVQKQGFHPIREKA